MKFLTIISALGQASSSTQGESILQLGDQGQLLAL